MSTLKRTTVSEAVDGDTVFNRIELLRTEFFLPPECLVLPDWRIYPIKVLDSINWNHAWQHLKDVKANITLIPNSDTLLKYARWVGFSVRENIITGEKFVVAKLWMTTSSNREGY